MSYGIWKTRGKGWSAIEIDSPGNDFTLEGIRYSQERHYSRYASQFERAFEAHGGFDGWEDLAALKWQAGQVTRNPHMWIASYSPGGGEHVRWVAFDGPDGLLASVEKDGANPVLFGWSIEFDRMRGDRMDWMPPQVWNDPATRPTVHGIIAEGYRLAPTGDAS